MIGKTGGKNMQVGPISFTATPSMEANGQIAWSYCQTDGACGTAAGHFPPISLPQQQNGAPATPVTITIAPNNLGITFAPGHDAMWLQQGAGNCPQSQVWDPGTPPQITGFARVSNTQIKFNDVNSKVADLTYRLNFVNTNQQAVTPIDPDIKNGGTNLWGGVNTTQLLIASAVVALVVSLIVSLISSYIIAQRTARRELNARAKERNGQ